MLTEPMLIIVGGFCNALDRSQAVI
jgi:hypothetical protein